MSEATRSPILSLPEGGLSELLIRTTRVDDTDAVTALVNLPGYRFGTLRLPFQSVQGTRKWLEQQGDDGLSLVAVLDGAIVGNLGLFRDKGRRRHAAHFGMGVHDQHVGKGIGTALLAALIDAADNWLAIRRLELTVYTDNAAAIHLYEKSGFVREGILRDYAFRAGTYVDAFTMARLHQ
ncbi:acetyltransferase [Labrys miyagiensis]|uniref:Acetyltransferase n=1 Tax=Labrys miyagiensis TaxID=346912 RepID=A0ABQ6CCG6_9HYPH|nr:GNAT family N-acetyltransferase [Labrys miyagiensis]GLS17983.1 acetyltransferase [Labrys miyagiensis]